MALGVTPARAASSVAVSSTPGSKLVQDREPGGMGERPDVPRIGEGDGVVGFLLGGHDLEASGCAARSEGVLSQL